MALTHTPPHTATKRPAWLLVLTLPAFIAYVALAVATIAQKVDSTSAELTPAQLSDLGVSWIALHLLWMTPSVLAAIGLAQLAASWRLPRAAAVRTLAAVVLVLAAAYLVVQLLAFGFEGNRWGDSRLFPLGVILSLAAGWVGTLPATMLVTTALARRGIARRSALAITALSALYLAVEVLIYLPAIVGSTTFADTVGLPPFLLGFFWAWLGGAVLRARVTSQVRRRSP
jgi:hypothetical protein